MACLEVNKVCKSFGSGEVLCMVSFTLERGKVLAIVGPSGSGKTTLLRCIIKLERISEGSISCFRFQSDVRIGMVFQGFHLWPHLTVLQNIIEAPIQVLKMSRADAIARARELLHKVGLADKENSYPATLSGGQQQRVAIARAMAMDPDVLLLDEITSALDPELAWEVLEVIKAIVNENDVTVLIVTHEMGFAREIADEMIVLVDGRIIEKGTPQQVLDNPQEDRTKQFLGRIL